MKDYTGKAPFYQEWGEQAFIFDTRHLHWQARLFYRALLQSAWHLTTRPDLPADDSQLQNILAVPSDVWDTHKAAVRAMFTLDAENGVLWQKRLRADWRVLVNYREKQKELANRRYKNTADAGPDKSGETDSLKEKNRTSRVENELSIVGGSANPLAKADAKASLSPLSSGPSGNDGSNASRTQSDDLVSDRQVLDASVTSASPHKKRESPSEVPESSIPRPSGVGNGNGKGSGPAGRVRPSPDVIYLQSVCHELECRTPRPADVQELLDRYPVAEIEAAFREYVESLDGDLGYAEKSFYVDGGGAAVILARSRRPASER